MGTTQTSKAWYTSITIWGGLIDGLEAVIQLVTKTLDSTVGTHLQVNPIVLGILGILGTIMVIVGRFSAIMPITSVGVPTSSPTPIVDSTPITTTVTKTVITSNPPMSGNSGSETTGTGELTVLNKIS